MLQLANFIKIILLSLCIITYLFDTLTCILVSAVACVYILIVNGYIYKTDSDVVKGGVHELDVSSVFIPTK